jgi:hypothetical protein
MNRGPFERFMPRMPKHRKGLGADAIGGDASYDPAGNGVNPNPSAKDSGEGYDAIQGANPAPDIDIREGYLPTDSQAQMNTVTTKKILTPNSFQIIKFQKPYFPDEDCQNIEAIGWQQSITANPTDFTVFSMPASMTGVYRYLGFDSNEFADRTFTIFINGIPIQGYSNFQGQIGTIARPFDTFIPIPPQSTTIFRVIGPSTGGGNIITWRFKGWFWPINSGTQETIVEHYGPVNPEEEGLI